MASEVILHPQVDLNYASFVLMGLLELSNDAVLATDGFPRGGFAHRRPMAVRLSTSDGEIRVYYDGDDMPGIEPEALRWSDVYLKTNLSPEDPARDDPRLVLTGPTFGCRIEPISLAARLLVGGQFVGGPAALGRALRALGEHSRRQPLRAYDRTAARSDDDYVFFAAWPWAKHEEVNPPRANFIRACRSIPELRFEGGFVPRRRLNPISDRALMATRRYNHRAYLERLSKSSVVFNNPAVHGCLGWKLGEFMALGKAIISTPLNRRLPAPLVHGEHVHFVPTADEDVLRAAVSRIVEDHAYRRQLETGARDYFDRYVTPRALVERALERAGTSALK